MKKSNRKKTGIIASIVLVLSFLLFTSYIIFDDLLLSKSEAREILKEHQIVLNDDFEVTFNQSGGFRDYTHKFELSISEKDKRTFIEGRIWDDKPDERIQVHSQLVDRYEGDTLRANYTNGKYIYSMYRPNGKGIVPTFVQISVLKDTNTLTYEEILD
ncbi:hypothetical protein M2408_005068 [Sphingobacterium sp. BIGb0165]|nr:hypothetical protein [Sphingobacterium sp. BIGb0165]